jgi:mRNA interferase HigB
VAFQVLGRDKLVKFWTGHPQARRPLQAWFADASRATWQTPQDIRNRYPSASFLSDDRVVFNIKGNDYRLLVQAFLRRGRIVIERVGTHAEYDRWAL